MTPFVGCLFFLGGGGHIRGVGGWGLRVGDIVYLSILFMDTGYPSINSLPSVLKCVWVGKLVIIKILD